MSKSAYSLRTCRRWHVRVTPLEYNLNMRAVAELERSGDDWNEAGSELRRVDPALYLEILALTKRAVTAHTRPADLLGDAPQIVSLRRGGPRGSA